MVKYCHPFVGNSPDLGQEFFASVVKVTLSGLQCIQYSVIKETLICLICYSTTKTIHYATSAKICLLTV
jgi:hypothetical protein